MKKQEKLLFETILTEPKFTDSEKVRYIGNFILNIDKMKELTAEQKLEIIVNATKDTMKKAI